MTRAEDVADAWWPNSDDTQEVRTGRSVVVRFANINSNQTLTAPSGGCTFANVKTFSAPQIACRESHSTAADCVVSWRDSVSDNESFSFLNTSTSGGGTCSIASTIKASFRADGPVSVAWGQGALAVGIATRPPDVGTHPGELVIYRPATTGIDIGDVFVSQKLALSVGDHTVSTHTEPRISYHRESDRYLVAYPDQNTNVRLLSLDHNGLPLASTACTTNNDCSFLPLGSVCSTVDSKCTIPPFDTGYDSLLPAEVICGGHNPQNYDFCTLYITPTSASSNIKNGGFIREIVNFNYNGTLSIADTPVESGANISFIVTGGSYGLGSASPQPTDGFWLNAVPFGVSTTNEIRFMFDSVGIFNDGIHTYANTYFSLNQYSHAGFRANVSGIDWSENVARFVIVTATL